MDLFQTTKGANGGRRPSQSGDAMRFESILLSERHRKLTDAMYTRILANLLFSDPQSGQ